LVIAPCLQLCPDRRGHRSTLVGVGVIARQRFGEFRGHLAPCGGIDWFDGGRPGRADKAKLDKHGGGTDSNERPSEASQSVMAQGTSPVNSA
jgi:hypothetical protein